VQFSIFEWKYLKSDHLEWPSTRKRHTIRLPDAFKRLEFSTYAISVGFIGDISPKGGFQIFKNDFLLRASLHQKSEQRRIATMLYLVSSQKYRIEIKILCSIFV
jgi:hypothetical protein